MTPAAIEKFLLSLPRVTLSIQWGANRVFKMGGKMFAILSPEGSRPRALSFKAGDDSFHILTKLARIIPAPYLARAHWVYLERLDALPPADLRAYLARAHAIVSAGLPRKAQIALGLLSEPKRKAPKKRR